MTTTPDQPQWRRSSFCNFGDCVEVTRLADGAVSMRSSRDPSRSLAVTADEWAAFTAGVRAGEFDAEATPNPELAVAPTPDEAAAPNPNALTWLASQLDSIAQFQDRPGAMAQVEDIAARLRVVAADQERLRGIEQRARDIYEHPADHPLTWHQAARHILGETDV